MTQFPDHGLFFQQIVWRLIDMGKAVNRVTGKMRGCGSQLPEFGIVGHGSIESDAHNVLATQQSRVVTLHQFAIDIDVFAHGVQFFLVFFECTHSYALLFVS